MRTFLCRRRQTNFSRPAAMLNEIEPLGTIFSLVGEFDLSQRARLHEAFGQAMGQVTVIIDLTSATYIDSTVLGCLIRFRKTSRSSAER